MKKLLLLLFITISTVGITLAQRTVTGLIADIDGTPLIGANITVKGTSEGTITNIEGNYSIDVPEGSSILVFSYTGFTTREIAIGESSTIDVTLAEGVELSEIVVTGTMDNVMDRRTPVAVSTITSAEIQAHGGNVEFPELMKSTPSIFVAQQAGGYGDSEVFTRGFDQTNTAFLLNGQPINGMEDGKMYWSNWSGMSDVATAVQVQRGLGSSKLAISSVGGTTNIIMKPTERDKGGSVSFLRGNNNYNKALISYNTGMINDKFGVSMLLSHWQGDGWAEGNEGQGQSYFLSAGYKPNENHSLNFLITGAPQTHNQNFSKRISDYFRDGELNVRWNGNWGLHNGEKKTSRGNYYHKPVINLNWDWSLSEKSSLSTVIYGSFGRGGSVGPIGSSSNRFFTSEGQWDFDAIEAANIADAGESEYVLRNSVNNHSWFGLVSNYNTSLSESLSFSVGTDLRSYRGSHFRQLTDLLGAPAYTQRANARFPEREVSNTYTNNPWGAVTSSAPIEDRIAFNNDETIRYAGIFGQLEYSTESFSGYVQGAVSNQSHVRYELFNETESNEKSERSSKEGYFLVEPQPRIRCLPVSALCLISEIVSGLQTPR